jgi:hypothetical protein
LTAAEVCLFEVQLKVLNHACSPEWAFSSIKIAHSLHNYHVSFCILQIYNHCTQKYKLLDGILKKAFVQLIKQTNRSNVIVVHNFKYNSFETKE